MASNPWRGVGSVTGLSYGTPEYGKAWRELHKDRLAAERKEKYHTTGRQKYLRRSYWINKYKISQGCNMCGYNLHAVALDFDHLDPHDKKFSISSRLPNSTIKRLFNEIRKCRVLCANCHRVHTMENNHFDPIPRST